MNEFRILVVAYDFSPHSDAALFAAIDLAKKVSGDLHLLHVAHEPGVAYPSIEMGGFKEPEIPPVPARDAALEALQKRAAEIDIAPLTLDIHVVEGGAIDRAIVEFSRKLGADLIVMGTHGRTGMAHVFLGSVTERTLRRAPCPVLAVQSRHDDADGQQPAEDDG